MEFRHLRYIIAVAEEGHITRAAERLGIAQPPLSRLIKAIEQDIKVQLFRRVPRGVELTDAGRTFLDGARATFANLDRTLESARRTARGEEGRISVASTSSTAFHPLVPRVIREFREAFPRVTVTLAQGNPTELIEHVKAIDSMSLSAGQASSSWRDLSSIHCWRNRWWWLCPTAMRSPGAKPELSFR